MKYTPQEHDLFGVRFRSSLEAAWATFFNDCNEPWEYEQYTFTVGNNARYTPDFYLPDSDTFIEVKGAHDERLEKAVALAHALKSLGTSTRLWIARRTGRLVDPTGDEADIVYDGMWRRRELCFDPHQVRKMIPPGMIPIEVRHGHTITCDTGGRRWYIATDLPPNALRNSRLTGSRVVRREP